MSTTRVASMSSEQLWRVPVLGALDHAAIGKLEAASIKRRATSEARMAGGGPDHESHGLYLRAPSAEAAAEKVSATLDDVPVYVAADETALIEE